MRIESTPNGGIRVLAPAKLNLYLEVGPRRSDGFHEIDSLFHAVTLFDELEFDPLPAGEIRLEEDGIAAGEKNIVLKAAHLLRRSIGPRAEKEIGVRIRLRKGIPEGAGLGGGSSDAAATLVGLSSLWGWRSGYELFRLAAELGSDVPFFLVGGTARCRGRGEIVSSWASAFDGGRPLHFVLVYPRLKVPTKVAYEMLDASRGHAFALTAPSPLDSMPPASIRARLESGGLFFNRFEDVVYSSFPALGDLHACLSKEPFVKVLLSGSGSTIYGVCRDGEEARRLAQRLSATLAAEVFAVSSERGGAEALSDEGP